MAELLSPGVFIEEVPSQVQVVPGVSTSNAGFVGFTARGPVNDPQLVTSFDQFTNVFGALVSESFTPLSVAAFFANGGRRAFVSRVVPSDADLAEGKITSQTRDQEVNTGDGVTTAFSETGATSVLKSNAGDSPVVPGSVSIRWRTAGTPVTGEAIRNRDDSADVTLAAGTDDYEGRVDPTALGTNLLDGTTLLPTDEKQFSIVPGTFVLNYDPDGSTPSTLAVTSTDAIATATNGAGTQITLDHRTGIFSVKFAGADSPTGSPGTFTVDYTPADTPASAFFFSATDDGAGTLTGDNDSGAIGYGDGTWDLDLTTETPHDAAPILFDYQIDAWDLNPVSAGAWGNDLRVQVVGNDDYYTASTGQFSRFNLEVQLESGGDGAFVTQETFDEVVFDDSTSSQYFPDVLNALSDLVTVTEPGGDEEPLQLQALSSTVVFAGGDETTPGATVTGTLGEVPVQPRTLSIAYTDDTGTSRTVTDDGSGNLTGDVDPSGTNTVNYTSGAVDFTALTGQTIQGGTLVVASYAAASEVDEVDEDFGDTTEQTFWPPAAGGVAAVRAIEAGSNGTFTSSTYGRNQISNPSLEASDEGIFALNRIEQLMQVVVPDFVGDVTITGDILDYVDGRESQPAGADRFAILAVPAGSSAQEAVDWKRFTLNRSSKFAALYWPHVTVADPLSDGRDLTMPPLGHIAGIYARTDSERNVAKAPAGAVDGRLNFITGLELQATQGERDLVYPASINPLVSSQATNRAVWGVRTMASVNESEWRYISVRRLFMFMERSIFNATHWIVFENINQALFTRVKAQLNGFLGNLFADGLLAGSSPNEAFLVTVDDTNNTPTSIASGQLIIDVAVAPLKPAEFVRFRFRQRTLES